MSKLILFGGDLASGKSTYSNIIGEKFNITVINKDRIKEILGDIFIAENREENLKLSKASFEIMKYEIEKNKDILLLESNFKDYEMEEIYNLISINLHSADKSCAKPMIRTQILRWSKKLTFANLKKVPDE